MLYNYSFTNTQKYALIKDKIIHFVLWKMTELEKSKFHLDKESMLFGAAKMTVNF